MALKIFVLTGAGVSAESGAGTFRDKDGLWSRYDLEAVATPQGFARDPETAHAFYNLRRGQLATAEPNAAHRALAELERDLASAGGELFLCTQNVDDLHERAGSRQVAHMHGELTRVRCGACGHAREERGAISAKTACAGCGRAGALRPDVVWFGEVPRFLDAIDAAVRGADLFVAIGTSGSVYPAAGLVETARAAGVRTCELNLEPSDNAWAFDTRRYGPASEVVPAWAAEIRNALPR